MTRKFILIDHSVKDSGGHHLEYAKRVLRAAKMAGFKTVLGTHKDCEDIAEPNIDVVDKAFTHTFWDNASSAGGLRRILNPKERNFLKRLKARWDQLPYDLLCSPLGFSYTAAFHHRKVTIPKLLNKYATSTARKRLSPLTIIIGYVLARLSVPERQKKYDKIIRPLKNILKFLGYIFLALVGLAFSPLLILLFFLRWKTVFGRSDLYAMQFHKDLERMFNRVHVSSGDLIFIPTLGNVELSGAALCVGHHATRGVTWHFLFRRNLFEGRDRAYPAQLEGTALTLRAFASFKARCADSKAFFYTDSDTLTTQYNLLGVFPFKTLPIPLDEALIKSKTKPSRPLTISYIGDARDEKGFPLLGRLVADLRAAGYGPADIQFKLQANFNVLNGEVACRIAKSELATEQEWVKLVEGPFGSVEYTSFVNESDIILVPYNMTNYYARSSSIFAEALAAGIPTVATHKTWMFQGLLQHNQRYMDQLLSTRELLQTCRLINSKSNLSVTPKSAGDHTWLMIKLKQRNPRPGEYLCVNWETEPPTILKSDRKNYFSRQSPLDLRNTEVSGFVRAPAQKRIDLYFSIEDGVGKIGCLSDRGYDEIELTVYELEPSKDLTQYFASSFYAIDEDFSQAVCEMVENYPLYLSQAQSIRNEWHAFHSATYLVKLLDEAAT